jgi:hypothetical protein
MISSNLITNNICDLMKTKDNADVKKMFKAIDNL